MAELSNAVAFWNDIANKPVLASSSVHTTPEVQRPAFCFDLASVHLAIDDAVVAIEGRYKPFAVKPRSAAAAASTEAAVSAIQVADAACTPVLPAPNHPEYPAAHSCTSGSVGEALRHFGPQD